MSLKRKRMEEEDTSTSQVTSDVDPTSVVADGLTEDEAKVYDRQLRVWGVEAQQRIKGAKILLYGRVNAMAAEIAKNLALAGIGHLALADDSKV